MMIPTTVDRVPDHTAPTVNHQIEEATRARIRQTVRRGPAAINQRLLELDAEWDIERILEANASSAVLAGVSLGMTVDKRWFWLPAAVGGFLLQHAIQGWCPPMIWFRRMGFRTQSEIEAERNALKALRGDYRLVQEPDQAFAVASARS